MPTPYVAAVDGEWDASVTNTWGQGIGVYPNTAGDVVTIGAGRTVTYNKVSIVELGAMSITGLLIFSTAMSTKLTMSHNDITINNGGELRVGANGAIIPKAYTAEVIWNTTADGTKGISIAAGGKLTAYGDPDYFGSDYDDTLSADGTNGAGDGGAAGFIVTTSDMSAKWVIGQQLLIHKGATYASSTTDFLAGVGGIGLPTIVSFGAANKINIDVLVPTTFKSGADVLNLSRNVMFYKLNYVGTPGNTNTNRPRLTNANAITTSNITVNDAMAAGWTIFLTGNRFNFTGVIRNSQNPTSLLVGSTFTGVMFCASNGMISISTSTINGYIVGSSTATTACWNCMFTADIYGNIIGLQYGYENIYNTNVYSNGIGIKSPGTTIIKGRIGYNRSNVVMANTNDFDIISSGVGCNGLTLNLKVQSSPTFSNRNDLRYHGRYRFEHYQQVANAHYIADAYGDITKTAADGTGDNPTQRSGGSADVIEAVPQSNCAAISYLELLNIRLWAAAGVSKTYRFYIQTNFATLGKGTRITTSGNLVLYGEYLDEGSGGHLASISSSGTGDFTTITPPSSDWSQYVEVTINPAQTGYVNLYMRLMGYEAAKKVWVDPMGVIT